MPYSAASAAVEARVPPLLLGMPHSRTPAGLVTGDRRDQRDEPKLHQLVCPASKALSAALRHDHKVKLGRFMEASIEDLHSHTRLRCLAQKTCLDRCTMESGRLDCSGPLGIGI